MAAYSTITGDCGFISIVASGAAGTATIAIRNGNLSYNTTLVLPTGNGTANLVLNTQSTVGAIDGVFDVKVTDSAGVIHSTAVLGKCALMCCIAKKLDSLLGCDCGCVKCNSDLLQAERVNLLILSIETSLAQVGQSQPSDVALITNAERKYQKALELCSDNCGCSC